MMILQYYVPINFGHAEMQSFEFIRSQVLAPVTKQTFKLS